MSSACVATTRGVAPTDRAVNGFDVRAIGWVVTRDACTDIARTLLGARREIAAEALQPLGDRWLTVRACLREDAHAATGNPLRPLATTLPPRSQDAVNDFVIHLVARCPQRYSEPNLRRRCLSAAAQAFVGIVGGTAAASFATPEHMFFDDVAVVLLLMACFSLTSTIQLWRTWRIVKRLAHPSVVEALQWRNDAPDCKPCESSCVTPRCLTSSDCLRRTTGSCCGTPTAATAGGSGRRRMRAGGASATCTATSSYRMRAWAAGRRASPQSGAARRRPRSRRCWRT